MKVPCRLKIRVESFKNLPKLSKGPAGCDPIVVIEVIHTTNVYTQRLT
jgi:hypothetical protein